MPGWLRRVTHSLPALLTLLALAGVAVWGMRHDWQLPAFAALWGDPPAEEEASSDKVQVLPDPVPESPVDPKFPEDRQKQLRFASAEAVHKAGIRWLAAEERPMTQRVTATAMLDYVPSRYLELHSPVTGRVWSVEKEFGAPVKKGDVLLVIDAAEVGKAKADFLQSLTQLNYHEETLQRMQASKASLRPQAILDEQTAVREARTRALGDQQRLLNLGFTVPLKEFQSLTEEQASRRLRVLGLSEDIVKRIDADNLTANLLPLRASFDGQVVTHPHAAPGQVVGTPQAREGEPLFVVADISELHIEMQAHAEDAPYLQIGQEVMFVSSNAGGATATGKIAHISPEVNEKTRRVEVHAETANPDRKLRPRTFGTATVVVRQEPLAIVVPAEAIQADEVPPKPGEERRADRHFSFLFVRTSDKSFQVRSVMTELREGGFIQVRGVRAGEEVATAGSYVLKSELFKERIAGGD
jgi:cobalt-zinc-cadmium efflux system membrane fusion protein